MIKTERTCSRCGLVFVSDKLDGLCPSCILTNTLDLEDRDRNDEPAFWEDEPPVAPPSGGWPFRVTELFNERPRGFGANHNKAFAHCDTGYFCVLNPDVTLRGPAVWEALLAQAGQAGVGLAYPVLLNPDGSRQDSEREAVTPLSLLRRHLLGRAGRRVDWVSAAFWVVPAPVYRALAGFDERYFMYCEDTDFCLRLRLAGWSLARAETAVTHEAARSSRSQWRPLVWHVRSLVRLWSGAVLRRYLALRAGAS